MDHVLFAGLDFEDPILATDDAIGFGAYRVWPARLASLVQLDGLGAGAGDMSVDPPLNIYGATSVEGARVKVFDLFTGALLKTLPQPSDLRLPLLSVVRLDPSVRRLLVGDPEGNAQLWDVATWKPIDNSAVADSDIAVGGWSLDGELVATASSDGVVTIRDGETFEAIRTMVGATGTSNTWGGGTLWFSPDKSTLLTNFDGPGRLWDVASGQQIGVPFPSVTGTSGANVGDQLLLLTASEDSVLYWNLDMSTWAAAACRAAGSELTEAEWDQWGPRDTDPHALCD